MQASEVEGLVGIDKPGKGDGCQRANGRLSDGGMLDYLCAQVGRTNDAQLLLGIAFCGRGQ